MLKYPPPRRLRTMSTPPHARLLDLPDVERVAVLRDEIDRIAGVLADLDIEQLDAPAIGDWTVREVIAHLAVVAGFVVIWRVSPVSVLTIQTSMFPLRRDE